METKTSTKVPTIKEIALAVDKENASDTANTLTPKQELFCKYYTTSGHTFGNATLSYALAYGYDFALADRQRATETVIVGDKQVEQEIVGSSEYDKMENYCAVGGHRLSVRNDKVGERIRALMVEAFNDDAVMDKRLTEIALHGKDTDSIQAIKHRSDIKQRITKKLDVTTAGRPLAGLSDEELLKLAESTD